jgi:quercetin dioxygenase-like cupin family protein
MRNFKLVTSGIDPTPLLALIADHESLWREITIRQSYADSAHRDTETIFLRAPVTLVDVLNVLDSRDMPAIQVLAPALLPIMGRLTEVLQLRELGRTMLVKLKAGGRITPHFDAGAYARYFARFHYVLTSTPECRFTVGDETVHMAPGDLWWFDHQIDHHVENDGPDRIHLIFDATAPGYTGALANV